MLIGWFITWPARTYDIEPEEMVVLKEEYHRRDRVNEQINAMNKPLNEQLKPFNELFGKLNAEVTNRDFTVKQEIADRMLKEKGIEPPPEYPPQAIADAAVEEWETTYVENHEGELGEMHARLAYYQAALEPEDRELTDAEEDFKLEVARKYEDLLDAEHARKTEIRNTLMTEANLDPAKDSPTEEINKKVEEQFAAEPGDAVTGLRAELAALKPRYLEEISPWHSALTEAESKLPTPEEGAEPPAEKSEQQLLVENLAARQEIDWNSIPNYGWRDLKLAENPVAFDFSKWSALPWSKKIGRNPMERPPYEDPRVVDYQPRDAFYWNAWMMSQRAGTVAYPTFAAGASLLMYLLFYIACDIRGWQVPLFRTWGTNALAAYVLFELVCGAVKQFVPRDPVWWYGWGSLAVGMFLMWLVIRSLEKNKIFIRM
ncbi:MAG: hypothetical protein CL608_12115 [Anaerolineaceae bacterium]|nr:hypothetical protein [Anaerolineaceae bacterium]